MRRAGLIGAIAAIALAGCGGGDSSETAEAAPYEITVAEFIALIQPEKRTVLEAFVAQSETCAQTDVTDSLTLIVTAAGLESDPSASLPELIESKC